jgi:hypothetical protein
VVKRSKTFSPSAPISKSQYNCRVSYCTVVLATQCCGSVSDS